MELEREQIEEMPHDEFQQYWLSLVKKDAETDEYCKELLDTITRIIDTKDYSHLYYVMQSYDKVVKEWEKLKYGTTYKSEREYPFWCYCMGSTDTLMKDLFLEKSK